MNYLKIIIKGAIIIRSPRVTNWGDWYDMDNCRGLSNVLGFRQRVEKSQGGGDDTALNAIELICSDGGRIMSASGPWGSWSNDVICRHGRRANGFWLKQQPWQGKGSDDTAANAFSLRCDDGSYIEANNNGDWGSWSPLITCPSGRFICGISVQIEKNQKGGDDTTLNNVELMCC